MASNPKLEAVIEATPDDADSYFVYGDWLQTQGDPRGELVALQAAAMRDPTDEAAAHRVTEHLARNDAALLGALGEELDVVWFLGFWREVRIAADKDPARPIATLRAMLAHPSARFVRAISFAQPKIDASRVVNVLLDTNKPATLRELHLGGTFDIDADAPELREAFPQLARSLDGEWRRILATLSEQRAVDLRYDTGKLPRLEAKPGIDVAGVGPEHILQALRLEIAKNKPLGIVAALQRSFTPESLDDFAVALGTAFITAANNAPMKYGFEAIGRIGGPRAVDWIASSLGGWSHPRAVQGAALLAELGLDVAIWELYAIVMDPALHRPRRDDAAQIITRLARERRLDVDRLLDRAMPAVAAATRSRIRDAAIRRLQAHMVDGRRIDERELVHYVVRHPMVAPLARRVVWATYEGVDVETTFRLDGETARDAAGREVDLDGAKIGVLHPAELAADDRKAVLARWRQVFHDESIEPLFEQLDRPVHELRDVDRGIEITRFKLRSVGYDRIGALSTTHDWAPILEDTDGGAMTLGYTRAFPRDSVVAVAATGSGGSIDTVHVERGNARAAFATIHPVTASEILRTLELVTARQEEPAAVASGGIEKGMRVKIRRGANRLREGIVFWLGDGNNGARCGIRTEQDETLWANLADVKQVPHVVAEASDEAGASDDDDDANDAAAQFIATAAKPLAKGSVEKGALAKGTKVRWTKGRHAGTGVVFWLGKNKFGDGMRAGVTDDETRETVWVDATECTPAE